jgi:hypothetical protein
MPRIFSWTLGQTCKMASQVSKETKGNNVLFIALLFLCYLNVRITRNRNDVSSLFYLPFPVERLPMVGAMKGNRDL